MHYSTCFLKHPSALSRVRYEGRLATFRGCSWADTENGRPQARLSALYPEYRPSGSGVQAVKRFIRHLEGASGHSLKSMWYVTPLTSPCLRCPPMDPP